MPYNEEPRMNVIMRNFFSKLLSLHIGLVILASCATVCAQQASSSERDKKAIDEVGKVRVLPGEYEIQVKPSDIHGGELMRLFSISLSPTGNAGGIAGIEREAPMLLSP